MLTKAWVDYLNSILDHNEVGREVLESLITLRVNNIGVQDLVNDFLDAQGAKMITPIFDDGRLVCFEPYGPKGFTFDQARDAFLALCDKYSAVGRPRVVPSLPGDRCDVTDYDEVRLNIEAAQPIELDYYVRHVFGHYLCDQHCGKGDEAADRIADLIADIIKK